MELRLHKKRALITGSTAGIGHAIATSLALEGATVIVNGRTPEAVDDAVAALKAQTHGTVLGFAGDLSVASAAENLLLQHPSIDILVNNLGSFEVKAFEDISDADWLRCFEINVLSGARLARLCLPHMRAQNWGRIIFISSESGYQIPAHAIQYGTSKAAQIAVARGLAELTAGTCITVNSVLPGPTRSRGTTNFIADASAATGKTPETVEREFFETGCPSSLLKRFATTAEVAALVTYVASPLSSATNGAALRVDGGTIKSAY